MLNIIIINFIAFLIGVYSFFSIRKKIIKHSRAKFFFLFLGIIMLIFYLGRTFGQIYFKGIFTQEILLFGGISSLFMSMNFGMTQKFFKRINLILLFFIIPFLNQFLFIMLSAFTGLIIYNNEEILYKNNSIKIISQTHAPGISPQEDIAILRSRSALTEAKNTIYSMRYSKDSLRIKVENEKIRISDISKFAKFDTIIDK